MPYTIKKVEGGYKVCKKVEDKKCFSNKPLSKKKAIEQERAILANTHENSSKFDKLINIILNEKR